jgi:hypothetical protein
MSHVTWDQRTERSLSVIGGVGRARPLRHLGEIDPSQISDAISTKLTASFEQEMEARLVLNVAVKLAGTVVRSMMTATMVGAAATGVGLLVSAVIAAIEIALQYAQNKWDQKTKDRVDEFQLWSRQEMDRFRVKVLEWKTAGIKQMFSSGLQNYFALRMKGVDNTTQLAAVDARWAAVVAEHTQAQSLGLVVDTIDNRSYVGPANVYDHRGTLCGTIWYDGRTVQVQGLGDFWSSAKNSIVGAWKTVYHAATSAMATVSSAITEYIPKIAKIVQAPIHFIAVPAMKSVGWEGTATKVDNGTQRIAEVAVSAMIAAPLAVINPAASIALVGGQAAGALAQTSKDLTGSTGLMEKMEWIERKSTEVVASSLVTGAIASVAPVGLPNVGMQPVVTTLVSAVPPQDLQKIGNTLIGRDAFLIADKECREGVVKMYQWLAKREEEIKAVYSNEEFLRKGADGITYRMIADPVYAAEILAAIGLDPSLATMSLVPPAPSASAPVQQVLPSASAASALASKVLGPGVPPSGGGWGTIVLVTGATLILGPAAIVPAAVAGIALASKSQKV